MKTIQSIANETPPVQVGLYFSLSGQKLFVSLPVASHQKTESQGKMDIVYEALEKGSA